MYKLARFIYQKGRQQAYTEIIAELETLGVKLPPTREGQLLRNPINDTIGNLKAKLQVEEGKNVEKNHA